MSSSEGPEEFELEAIVEVRQASDGLTKEYKVCWKGYKECTWEPESNLKNAPQMLAQFKARKRQRYVVLLDEVPPMTSKRRKHKSAVKQRHASASSVDQTPEYQDPQATNKRPKQQKKQDSNMEQSLYDKRRKKQQKLSPSEKPPKQKQQVSSMEQSLYAKRRPRLQKLHYSTKEIAAASLLRLQSSSQETRVDGPSGRVSTRKAEHQLHLGPTLSQILSCAPTKQEALVDELFRHLEAEENDKTGRNAVPADMSRLRHLLESRGTDGNRGNPTGLAHVLRYPGCHLDDPLPEDEAAATADNRRRGRRLVHLAATAGRHSAQLLLHLLRAGADPDVRDLSGRTPLMLAARTGNSGAVERLLEFKANIDLCDDKGDSAVTLAAADKHWEAVASLLRHGAEFARLSRQPGFDSDQLAPWTECLSAPVLRAVLKLQEAKSPQMRAELVGAQPVYLAALVPGGLRAFTFVTRLSPVRSTHLLMTAAAELDGLGGVELRRVGRHLLASLTLNDQKLEPLAHANGLSIYPMDSMAKPNQLNKLRLWISGQIPSGSHLKLIAVVVCLANQSVTG